MSSRVRRVENQGTGNGFGTTLCPPPKPSQSPFFDRFIESMEKFHE